MSDKLFHSAGEHLDERTGALLRSGTAARLADVPVTTLRVWERRYGVVAGVKSATGQRLYSPHDVLRLKLLRQLTHSGHAIGTIATLELDALQTLAGAEGGGAAPASAPLDTPARRVVVVGAGTAQRVANFAGCLLLASHADLAQAQRAALGGVGVHGALGVVDVLLVQQASLQPASVVAVLDLAASLRADATVVLYTFGSRASVQALQEAGVNVQREPVHAAALVQWLQPARARSDGAGGVSGVGSVGSTGEAAGSAVERRAGPAGWPVEPQRFNDTELAELIELAATDLNHIGANAGTDAGNHDANHDAASYRAVVHCECMRHLAEIVVQLTAFERYSAECASTSVADAALHRQLLAVTGAARTRFEQALQRVVSIEGVALTGRPELQALF